MSETRDCGHARLTDWIRCPACVLQELDNTKLQIDALKKEAAHAFACYSKVSDEDDATIERLKTEKDDALRLNRALYDLLLARRAMEPKHSRYDHECDECIVLANAEGLLPTPTERPIGEVARNQSAGQLTCGCNRLLCCKAHTEKRNHEGGQNA